jgi:hypothetical protein
MTATTLPAERDGRLAASLAHPGRAFLLALGAGALLVVAAAGSPALALGALGGLGFLALLVSRPVLGLYLTAAVIPIERLGRLGDDSSMYTVSLMRVVGMLALGALLVHGLVRRRRFVVDRAFVLYALYVGLCLLTLTYTGDLVKSVQMAGTFLGNLLFLFLVLNLARHGARAETAVLVWLTASALGGIYVAYDWHYGSGQQGGIEGRGYDPGRGEQRAEDRFSTVWEDRGEFESLSGVSARRSMGLTSHALVYGINLILTLPFFLWELGRRPGWRERALVLAGLAIVLYNIFLTNTRSVLLVAAGTLALCAARGLLKLRPWHLAAGLALLLGLLLVAPVDVYNRILDASNYSPEHAATLRIRLAYWRAAARIIQENWLTGIGAGNELAVPRYVTIEAPEQTNVHNDYLQTTMETGLPGALLFFTFLGLLLVRSYRSAAALRGVPGRDVEHSFLVACQVAMIATLVYGLQVDVFHFPLKGWWLVAGLVSVKAMAARPAPREV